MHTHTYTHTHTHTHIGVPLSVMAVVLTPERMSLDFSEDTAHTIEVTREVNDRGERGSFGFNLNYEKPTVVGTVVPGELYIHR